MAAAWCVDYNPAYKLSISDIIGLKKVHGGWGMILENNNEPLLVHQFQIQVEIVQLSGFQNEIMIVMDLTGKAKITRGANVPGDFSWIKTGCYCSIIGTLIENGKLPHIDVVKIATVDNLIQIDLWPLEVQELKNYLSKKIVPRLEGM